MKQNLTSIFLTFCGSLFTSHLHNVTFYFYCTFFFFCCVFSNLFAPFAFHPFHIRFWVYYFCFGKVFQINFCTSSHRSLLLLHLFLMSFSHTFIAPTLFSFHFLTYNLQIFFLFSSVTLKHCANKCLCGGFLFGSAL